MEILAALGLICVSRLKRTWKVALSGRSELLTFLQELPEKHRQMYMELEQLMTSFQNYKNYRTALDNVNTGEPAIPYLGVYLRDLLFIEEGNADRLENGMIHFQKMTMVASIIHKIQGFQNSPFQFLEVEQIQKFFEKPQAIVSAPTGKIADHIDTG